jgi:hypothetical protein
MRGGSLVGATGVVADSGFDRDLAFAGRATTSDAVLVHDGEMRVRARNSLWAHGTGPPTPRPDGRRRTFLEWVFEARLRARALFLSVCALGFIATTAMTLLLVLLAALR